VPDPREYGIARSVAPVSSVRVGVPPVVLTKTGPEKATDTMMMPRESRPSASAMETFVTTGASSTLVTEIGNVFSVKSPPASVERMRTE
jgi:hypothetical protein